MQQRLTDTVDELQAVIQEIRTAIFDLHGSAAGTTRLRQRLDDAIGAFSGRTCGPRFNSSGRCRWSTPAWPTTPKRWCARRSATPCATPSARTLTITVRVEDDLLIEVVDDGLGMPADVTASGLTTCVGAPPTRAADFTVGDAPGGGTVLRWTAPLP